MAAQAEAAAIGGACPRRAQIRIDRRQSMDAKGPTWGRALGSALVDRESEFCLQTDAHMGFTPHWDSQMIQMYADTRNEYAVLTTYVADKETLGKNINGLWEVPHLCYTQWGEGGNVRNQQAKAARNLARPKLSTLWAAGLAFSKCHAERRVPYDPFTPHVFDGEEFSRGARLWTAGYDFYTPSRTVIAHDYKRSQRDAKHSAWDHGSGNERTKSHARLATLLEVGGVLKRSVLCK